MLLEIKKLNKEYTRGGKFFSAVKDVDLSVSPGDFFSIIGRSGSGKSTLLNLVAGLLTPASGEILINEKNMLSLTDKEASYLRNSAIGYISQGQSALANLSVLDNPGRECEVMPISPLYLRLPPQYNSNYKRPLYCYQGGEQHDEYKAVCGHTEKL